MVVRQAYFALVESHLRHGITAWGSSTSCYKLQNSQNQLLKILKNHYSNDLFQNNATSNINVYNSNNFLSNNSITTSNIYNSQGADYSNFSTTTNNNLNVHHQTTNTNHTTINNNPATNNIAKELRILNINSIYKTTMAIEFHNDPRFLHRINHNHQTRMNVEGRYRVQSYRNNYGESVLSVVLPKLFNQMPHEYINNTTSFNTRKKLFKNFFLNQQ